MTTQDNTINSIIRHSNTMGEGGRLHNTKQLLKSFFEPVKIACRTKVLPSGPVQRGSTAGWLSHTDTLDKGMSVIEPIIPTLTLSLLN